MSLSLYLKPEFWKLHSGGFFEVNTKTIFATFVIAIVLGVGSFASFKKGNKTLGAALAGINVFTILVAVFVIFIARQMDVFRASGVLAWKKSQQNKSA